MSARSAKLVCAFALVVLAPVSAKTPAGAIRPVQAEVFNGVLIPVPGEIFRVLDLFHDARWNRVLRPELAELQPAGGPPAAALSLGLLLGEGFIAIAAEDGDELQEIGKSAIKLARALGVGKSVVRREKSVIDHVRKNDWTAVRQEWFNVSDDLKEAMLRIESNQLSQLVSLGGWLRGIEALSALVAQNYSSDKARLLYQPELMESVGRYFLQTDNRFLSDPLVIRMQEGMARLQSLMKAGRKAPFSKQEVQAIQRLSADLVNAIRAEAG